VLAPHHPFRLSHLLDGTLVVEASARGTGGSPAPLAAIKLGARSAHAAPRRVPGGDREAWQFGDQGPLLTLSDPGSRVQDVFADMQLLPEEAPWTMLTRDFMVPLPKGLMLDSVPITEGPLFLLYSPEGIPDEVIVFQPRPAPPSELQFRGDFVEDAIDGVSGRIRHATRDYARETTPWRARHYVLTLTSEATLVMTAQSRHSESDFLFAAADDMARGYESMHTAPYQR